MVFEWRNDKVSLKKLTQKSIRNVSISLKWLKLGYNAYML